jgi:D-galactose 1-dehydrogenase
MSRIYQVAVVGLGKIAGDQHLPAIAGSARFALAASVDWHRDGVGVPHFRSLDALLASGLALDAVALCTPPQVREALAREALQAGLSVLLEKPPAASVDALAALGRHAATAGQRTLFAAWHSRYAPLVDAARAWLAGRLVIGGRIDWREDVRRWHPGQRWLWQAGGLGVFDPGINAFSILTALLSPPLRVTEATLDVPANAETPIAAQLALDGGGARIDATLDFLETRQQAWEIVLDTACGHRLRLADGGTRMQVDDGPERSAPSAEYPALYARFAELLDAGTSDADGAPLALVSEALARGIVRRVPPFIE